MDNKLYTLTVRNNTGAFLEKVTLLTDITNCKQILQCIAAGNKSSRSAEVLEGNRDYIGDFRVKPLVTYKVVDGNLMEP